MAKRTKPVANVEQPVHKMGQRTGYSTDGTSYWPAPSHVSVIEEILQDEEGIRSFLAAVTDHSTRLLARTAARKHRWWENVREDLGFAKGNWSYANGRIYPSKIQSSDAEPKEGEKGR